MYFDRKTEKGILFAFRQEECEDESLELLLPNVGKLIVCDKDSGETITVDEQKTTLKFEYPRCAKAYWVEVK